MKFVDYFLKDRSQLNEEDLYIKRLLAILLILLGTLSLLFTVISYFGFFKPELNLLSFIVPTVTLFAYKKYNFDLIPILAILILGSTILFINVTNTGYIYSYNNKWFVIFLIVILFVKPNWILPFLVFILALQVYFYTRTVNLPDCGFSENLRTEAFIDNMAFFAICYVILRLLYNHLDWKTKRLDKSKELLETRTSLLMQSNEELERFAYIASHDLKSPIRNIISFTMLLEKDLADGASIKQKEYLSYIKGGSEKLNILIDDVLDYSKLSNSHFEEFELIDINNIITSIKALLAETLDKKSGEIIIRNTLPHLRGQKTMFLSLFKNLIENGLKYNESQRPVIELKSKKEGDQYRVVVSDNGIGIERKYQNSIFEMFSRLHAESKYEGTGLGLAVCKKIMDKLKGNIELTSQLNQGSEFHLLFPVPEEKHKIEH